MMSEINDTDEASWRLGASCHGARLHPPSVPRGVTGGWVTGGDGCWGTAASPRPAPSACPHGSRDPPGRGWQMLAGGAQAPPWGVQHPSAAPSAPKGGPGPSWPAEADPCGVGRLRLAAPPRCLESVLCVAPRRAHWLSCHFVSLVFSPALSALRSRAERCPHGRAVACPPSRGWCPPVIASE